MLGLPHLQLGSNWVRTPGKLTTYDPWGDPNQCPHGSAATCNWTWNCSASFVSDFASVWSPGAWCQRRTRVGLPGSSTGSSSTKRTRKIDQQMQMRQNKSRCRNRKGQPRKFLDMSFVGDPVLAWECCVIIGHCSRTEISTVAWARLKVCAPKCYAGPSVDLPALKFRPRAQDNMYLELRCNPQMCSPKIVFRGCFPKKGPLFSKSWPDQVHWPATPSTVGLNTSVTQIAEERLIQILVLPAFWRSARVSMEIPHGHWFQQPLKQLEYGHPHGLEDMEGSSCDLGKSLAKCHVLSGFLFTKKKWYIHVYIILCNYLYI